jgi:hypothetical protein
MADSPAKRHLRRVLAAQEASARQADQPMDGSGQFELAMMQLHQDRLRLKQIQSNEGKAQLKAQLLSAYDPYVEGVLAEGKGATDEVITTLMIWNMDAGRYNEGLQLAEYVLAHGMKMPDRFQRTTGCLVAEEIAEGALNLQKVGGTFDGAILERAQLLTDGQDMPDEVRAKLHLAQARNVLAVGDPEQVPTDAVDRAIDHLHAALQLHGSCGGKKDLERALRVQKKQATASANGDSNG